MILSCLTFLAHYHQGGVAAIFAAAIAAAANDDVVADDNTVSSSVSCLFLLILADSEQDLCIFCPSLPLRSRSFSKGCRPGLTPLGTDLGLDAVV